MEISSFFLLFTNVNQQISPPFVTFVNFSTRIVLGCWYFCNSYFCNINIAYTLFLYAL